MIYNKVIECIKKTIRERKTSFKYNKWIVR